MSDIVTLSVENDFNGNFIAEYISQFTDYVNNSGQVVPTMLYVSSFSGDEIICQFSDVLSGAEDTAVHTLAGSFVYVEPILYNVADTFIPKVTDINTTSYTRIAPYFYPGTNSISTIQALIFIGNKDSGATNYSVRLEDITHSQTICEETFTNNTEGFNVISSVSNIPETNSLLEVQVKISGGDSSTYAHINSISLAI